MKKLYNHKLCEKQLDLVILAGGKGSRIKQLLGNLPKPMLKFNNKHFLQYLINYCTKYHFKRIIILTRYKNEIIFRKFNKKKINLIDITCFKEKREMGTGGALYNLTKLNVKDFILLNGDSIFNIDLNTLVNITKKKNIGSMALTSNINQKSAKLRNLTIKKNLIKLTHKSKYMNGGVYYFKRKFFKYIKNNSRSLEENILPNLIKKSAMSGKFFNNFFIDIGSKKFLKKGSNLLKKEFTKPSVFLDRDGVINQDLGHVYKYKDFKFRPGVLRGLKYLSKKNYYIFIVTNQAGIARGKYKELDFFKLHNIIKEKLLKKNIYIQDIQYSPYHPNAKIKKYKKISKLRKPGNQMIENIKSNWDINMNKSFMLGDKNSDKKAAQKSKLKFYYAKGNFFLQIKKIINNY